MPNMRSLQHVDQLLDLQGPPFLSGAYQALLGREIDDEGRRHYAGRLFAGYGKRRVIVEISTSMEARNFNAELQGLDRLIAVERKTNRWLRGSFFRSTRIERRFNQLEYQLECLQYQLSALSKDGGASRIGGGDGLTPSRDEARVDPGSLTPRARQILARFSKTDARSTDARSK